MAAISFILPCTGQRAAVYTVEDSGVQRGKKRNIPFDYSFGCIELKRKDVLDRRITLFGQKDCIVEQMWRLALFKKTKWRLQLNYRRLLYIINSEWKTKRLRGVS